MKAWKLIWLVSLALLAGLVSLTAKNLPAALARREIRADGGAPVPPPPRLLRIQPVSGINA